MALSPSQIGNADEARRHWLMALTCSDLTSWASGLLATRIPIKKHYQHNAGLEELGDCKASIENQIVHTGWRSPA
jgi:hypothetical protein